MLWGGKGNKIVSKQQCRNKNKKIHREKKQQEIKTAMGQAKQKQRFQ